MLDPTFSLQTPAPLLHFGVGRGGGRGLCRGGHSCSTGMLRWMHSKHPSQSRLGFAASHTSKKVWSARACDVHSSSAMASRKLCLAAESLAVVPAPVTLVCLACWDHCMNSDMRPGWARLYKTSVLVASLSSICGNNWVSGHQQVRSEVPYCRAIQGWTVWMCWSKGLRLMGPSCWCSQPLPLQSCTETKVCEPHAAETHPREEVPTPQSAASRGAGMDRG